MYQRVRSIISEDLVKVPLLNGIATVIRMLTGLISVKIVANLIGPSGIAMVGQLNNFSQILMNLSNGGIISGIVKYISENKNDENACKGYISTGFKITILLSLIISALIIILYRRITYFVFHDYRYELIIIILGLTIIFFAINSFISALLNGYQEYKKFIYVNIAGSITGLTFSVILALQYGLKGALIASITYQSVVLFITYVLIRGSGWFKLSNFTSPFRKDLLKNLGFYAMMAITSAVTVPASQFIARSFIVKFDSVNNAGLWEGVNRISSIYLMVITNSLAVYYLPRISQLKTVAEVRSEVVKVYKLMIPFLIGSSILIYIAREYIIKLLFSDAFNEMQTLFAIQMTAETIKICGYLLGYILIAKTLIKSYIYLEFQNFILLGVLNFFLVKEYGAWGACVSHAITYIFYLLVGMYLLKSYLFTKDPL